MHDSITRGSFNKAEVNSGKAATEVKQIEMTKQDALFNISDSNAQYAFKDFQSRVIREEATLMIVYLPYLQ